MHQIYESGALEFLGTAWPRSDPERWEAGNSPAEFWLADPLSGEEWPGAECYCFSVDYRNLRGRRGDVKYLWELNRLQFLHPIVAEAVRTGDHSWIEWAMRLLESWAHANPPYRGINWTSGIELALRLVTIALVVSAAKQDALQPKERKFIRQLIAAHGYWLNSISVAILVREQSCHSGRSWIVVGRNACSRSTRCG